MLAPLRLIMMSNVSCSLPSQLHEHAICSLLATFLRCDPNAIVITQLQDGVVNCYNNCDYKITIGNKNYFAKYGNPNGELLGTSLCNDIVCRTIAAEYGISTNVLLHDPDKNLMVTEFIDIEKDVDLKNHQTQKQYIALLQSLHTSGAIFPKQFCPFQMIKQYVEHSVKIGVEFPDALLNVILPAIQAFDKNEIFLDCAPCHLDPQSGNLLDDGTHLYLIDWECAAMSDPLFDLASMCAVEEFSDEEMIEILSLYLKKMPSANDIKRFYQMRIIADMRYCSYCYLQTKLSSTRQELYRTFAEGFLSRICTRFKKTSCAL